MSAQLVILGGTVIDGTGAEGVRADVAIENGRIKEIGRNLDGDVTLDASDHAVAPGFIDLHTHYDAQVFWDPALTPSCFHGVTTVVAGNCGFSIAPTRPEHHEVITRTLEKVEDMNFDTLNAGIPWDFSTFPEYLDSVERHGLGMNFSAYIGHTAMRLFVMGDAAYERAATDEEVGKMQDVLRDGMRAGAIGFATTFAPTHRGMDGKPVPSRFATFSELEALLDDDPAVRCAVHLDAPHRPRCWCQCPTTAPNTGFPVEGLSVLAPARGQSAMVQSWRLPRMVGPSGSTWRTPRRLASTRPRWRCPATLRALLRGS